MQITLNIAFPQLPISSYLLASPAAGDRLQINGHGTKAAIISHDLAYRYVLVHLWDEKLPGMAYVLLNPSTADACTGDPTITRCAIRARQWGYGGMFVYNLFAYRATDPRALRRASDPVGPDNDRQLIALADSSLSIVAGWGVHGALYGRQAQVIELLRQHDAHLHYLELTQEGFPRHPLYIPYHAMPRVWEA